MEHASELESLETKPALRPAAEAIRAKLLEGTAAKPDFAAATNKTERTIDNYIAQGMPVIYVGRTPYVLIDAAIEWLRTRRTQQQPEPRRPGRPRKAA